MVGRRGRSLLVVIAVVATASTLLAVSVGRAGNSGSGASLTVMVLPGQLSVGSRGLVVAKFTAASGAGTGSATGVAINLTFPSGTDMTSVSGANCAPDSTIPSTVDCAIGTVHAGQTVTEFVTFTAAVGGAVTGRATYDGGSTSNNGGANVTPPIDQPPATAAFAVYPAGDTTQGVCGGSSGTLGKPASSAQLKGTVAQWSSGASGFPCTPVSGGVVPGTVQLPTGATSSEGIWFVFVPKLGASGSDTAQVAITFFSLPSGTTWKRFQVYEIPNGSGAPLSTPVPPCTAVPSGYAGLSCVGGRSNFGQGGVQLSLLVKGSLVDPRYVG